ncbi:hypothetical protein PHBOTO_001833 [Pseudozyma hubeiensis]|nr:hypothetical protein PHBOTO_001833 [Pseudozyma hubeiensis]
MSQPGSSLNISPLASAGNAADAPAIVPAKAAYDEEAEEGEIIDEEEGEISESQAVKPTDSPTAPSQSVAAVVAEPDPDSPKQPMTPELPAGPIVTVDNEQQKDTKETDFDQASAPAAIESTAQASQTTEPGGTGSGQVHPTTDAAPVSSSGVSTPQATVPELTGSENAAAFASAEASDKPQDSAAESSAPQKTEDQTTPALTATAAPDADAATGSASLAKEQTDSIPVEEVSQTVENATTDNASPSAAKAQPTESGAADTVADTVSTADEASGMEVDDKVVTPAQPSVVASRAPAEPEPEPMQIDDSVHTPALPSDGPEAPAPAEQAGDSATAETEVQDAALQERPQPQPRIKGEPQPQAFEQSQREPMQAPETVVSETVNATPSGGSEVARKEETSHASLAPGRGQSMDLQKPYEVRQRSATPRVGTDAQMSEASAPKESQRRATVERDDPSTSRPSNLDPDRSRTANRGSAAPSSGQERRLEKERTKDRSHPSERSQDREQRAREKDRRRELERVERERERERERIRESERDREIMIARENEEARLIWLSLPGNDHPQYYTDTDSDSCYGVGGALGVDLTDEEDKDLNPPLPLSLQTYHPAPSYSQIYFDDAYYTSKRKRTDGADGDDAAASSRRYRRKPVSKPSPAERFAPMPRNALPSTTMIDIDNFPVPDSSIRGEPSERPFASRIERASLPHISPFARLDDAAEDFDSSDSDEEAMRLADERKRRHGNRSGNRGNKLSRDKGARWVRRGKLGGWTEMRMEKEIGDRVRHRVEAMQKDNMRALLSAMPEEDKAMLAQFPALRNGLIPSDAPNNARRDARGRLLPSDVSEAARIDAELGLDGGIAGLSGTRLDRPEHLTSTSLAPTLLKPAITPRQLLTSHTLRHTFRNPHIAALGKTALDLIESEGVVGRAVGRCWAAMERGGWNQDPEPKGDEAEQSERHQNGVNGMDVDGSDAEEADGSSASVFGSVTDNPALSHLDRLFVTKQGLAIPRLDDMGQPIFVPPSPATQTARAQAGLAEEAANEAAIETTLLPAPEQRSIVLAALECLHDLAADSREYVERLEEVRSRLAAVKRRRVQVWNAVRQWALDKDEAAEPAGGARADNALWTAETPGVASVLSAAAVAGGANGTSPRKRK